MERKWDYRHELIDFKRHEDGSISYQVRSEGEIPYEPFKSTKLLFDCWEKTRELAEETGRDVISYVIGGRILSRVRTVCSSCFY